MYSLRYRGVNALKEPDVRRRLPEMSDEQLVDVDAVGDHVDLVPRELKRVDDLAPHELRAADDPGRLVREPPLDAVDGGRLAGTDVPTAASPFGGVDGGHERHLTARTGFALPRKRVATVGVNGFGGRTPRDR